MTALREMRIVAPLSVTVPRTRLHPDEHTLHSAGISEAPTVASLQSSAGYARELIRAVARKATRLVNLTMKMVDVRASGTLWYANPSDVLVTSVTAK